MPGNPYRIAMLLFASLGALAALTFVILGIVADDAFRTPVAFTIAWSAAGFAGFLFTVWLIVSAARWRPDA